MAYLSKNEISEAIENLLAYGPASQNSTPILFLLSFLRAKVIHQNNADFHSEVVQIYRELCLIYDANGEHGLVLMEPFSDRGITPDRGRVKKQTQIRSIVSSNVFSKLKGKSNYPSSNPYLTKPVSSNQAIDFELAPNWLENLKSMLSSALPSLAIFALRPFEISKSMASGNDIINALNKYYGQNLGLSAGDLKSEYKCSSSEPTELKDIDSLINSLNQIEFNQTVISEEESESNHVVKVNIKSGSFAELQKIYYGAPGTGKSHIIDQITANENVIRTTFHPDSDYASFVGSYKPVNKQFPILFIQQGIATQVKDQNNTPLYESKIVYEYVEQAFLKAYVSAWTEISLMSSNSAPKTQYLIIEEINRGNCAQIFGDIFQLLDRNNEGFSKYPIIADKDMQEYLKDAMAGLEIPIKSEINLLYNQRNIIEQILQGKVLVLPSNLRIWATMNTSDQSLFPIDSAFKRRWEWVYMPISEGVDSSGSSLGWQIEINNKHYDWWQFITAINDRIGSITNSEDKKLGYFFCKASNKIISAETFSNKVIFYLWNDVFKDFGQDNDIFKDDQGDFLSFDKLFKDSANGYPQLVETKAECILTNLGLTAIEDSSNNLNP